MRRKDNPRIPGEKNIKTKQKNWNLNGFSVKLPRLDMREEVKVIRARVKDTTWPKNNRYRFFSSMVFEPVLQHWIDGFSAAYLLMLSKDEFQNEGKWMTEKENRFKTEQTKMDYQKKNTYIYSIIWKKAYRKSIQHHQISVRWDFWNGKAIETETDGKPYT